MKSRVIKYYVLDLRSVYNNSRAAFNSRRKSFRKLINSICWLFPIPVAWAFCLRRRFLKTGSFDWPLLVYCWQTTQGCFRNVCPHPARSYWASKTVGVWPLRLGESGQTDSPSPSRLDTDCSGDRSSLKRCHTLDFQPVRCSAPVQVDHNAIIHEITRQVFERHVLEYCLFEWKRRHFRTFSIILKHQSMKKYLFCFLHNIMHFLQ